MQETESIFWGEYAPKKYRKAGECVAATEDMVSGRIKGWLFTDRGALTGTFLLEETDTVENDGMCYKGNFVFKTYDTNGVFTGTEVNGTIAATRVTVS